MATLNGIVRSANASYKRAARAEERRARERAKLQQNLLKEQIIHNNISAVKSYNEFVNMLISVHKDCSEEIDWEAFLEEPEPVSPTNKQQRKNIADFALSYYKPSFFDKIFKLENRKRSKLINDVNIASKMDEEEYLAAIENYKSDFQDWEKVQEITRGILINDYVSFKNAVEFFNPYTSISQLGSRINFTFTEDTISINIFVNSSEVVPDYILSNTTTGKLSNRKMPISRFNELYQDYVCSCAIRVARETFALLPIDFVYVNAVTDLLDTTTGKISAQPVLSCKFFKETMQRLNFESIDCSDAMKNFIHVMTFNRNSGFSSIETLI